MEIRDPLPMLNAPETPRAAASPIVRLGDVVHRHEVARLLAVAVDGERLPAKQPVHEDRDDVAVGVVALVLAVHVEVPKTDALQRVELRVGEALLLGGELARAVRRVRLHGMILADRQRLQLAEDAGRRREHHLPDAVSPRRLEHLQRAEDVDLGIVERMLDRARVADRRRQVKHRVCAVHGRADAPTRRGRRPGRNGRRARPDWPGHPTTGCRRRRRRARARRAGGPGWTR